MKLRHLRIRVQTTGGLYGADIKFPDGLVVIWADNSMGKSTCVRSILVALGMDAMLTTSQSDLPLPPALKFRLNAGSTTEVVEQDVLESEVYLEIENAAGARVTINRAIKGPRNPSLITVFEGPALSVPKGEYQSADYFVNRAGAATRERGFHTFLANFFDWKLPTVQTYDEHQYPLYLQCIFPYLVVEQTRGWSSAQPPLPTHFRIREANKRVVEFLLSLDAHENAMKRLEITDRMRGIVSSWLAQIERAQTLTAQVSGSLEALVRQPVALWPPQTLPFIRVPNGDDWVSLGGRIVERSETIDALTKREIPRVEQVATETQDELNAVEVRVRDQQTLLSRLLDALGLEEAEVISIKRRLKAIEEDIQRNKDVQLLRKLGSREASEVDSGHCPVCHQVVSDSLVPLEHTHSVMTVAESISFLVEQMRTYKAVLANAEGVVTARTRQVEALRKEVQGLRDKVRTLRTTLISDGRLPSAAAIQARLQEENALKTEKEISRQFDEVLDAFQVLSTGWQAVQTELAQLPHADLSAQDTEKLTMWGESLKRQLIDYGFGSFPVDHVQISPDTYKPEHDGFDMESALSFQTSVSASDLIRTIWAYLYGLLEISRELPTNHPGMILFDEPRQQSARDTSFAKLLQRVSSSAQHKQQVLFFTSENLARLKGHLDGLPHALHTFDGRVLQKVDQF